MIRFSKAGHETGFFGFVSNDTLSFRLHQPWADSAQFARIDLVQPG
jgi:hypothetical protein